MADMVQVLVYLLSHFRCPCSLNFESPVLKMKLRSISCFESTTVDYINMAVHNSNCSILDEHLGISRDFGIAFAFIK